ncbi:DUF1476 family protein [Palleronia sediminis]|uniref:DUF1476 family protein n=1 Tax=Palleronia sediminis TaxID=2547833 RepID=A0A4R6AIQ6_9RHOB|nr:ATPase inhibitor subunit zeta [Palleronia sediminis]TDL84091.1 DUF1476 family protein [Palleronia sediminis]
MSTFDEREQAFEAVYAREADRRFRRDARRNRLLGEWGAGLLGLDGKAAQDFVKKVMRADFEPQGEKAVLALLADALEGHVGPDEIAERAGAFEDAARRDLGEDDSDLPS